ncbi:AraC-type DNA-binding protein [Halopseudomonas salegens]|uniref:AraC-type DNA-binding protein n=1 Tax=Halopseudomonas salegens TaxID=1434072 RepID=A0A1H2FSN5_9GAMM|nr:AraC-type DNA-binding protein [Halopseudomonas salegens]
MIRTSRESSAAPQEHACWLTLINLGLACYHCSLDDSSSSRPFSQTPRSATDRLSQDTCSMLWSEAVSISNEPLFGLRLMQQQLPTPLQAVALAARASTHLGAALDILSRYLPLLTNQARLDIHTDEQQAQLILLPIGQPHQQHLHAMLGYIVRLLEELHEHRPAQLRIEMPLEKHVHAEAEKLLQHSLQATTDYCRISLPRAALEIPLSGADDILLNGMHDTLGNMLAHTPTISLIEQVKKRILTLMSSGEISEKAIAEPMKISPRHLRRKLNQHGTTYEQLVDEVRRDNALRLIADHGLSLTEIAYELGFLDPSSFTRAFRRWTDMSPTGYRRQQAGGKRRLSA